MTGVTQSVEPIYYPKLSTLPEAWKRSSFTGIGGLWLLSNNFYLPSDYKIRKITDVGSIKKLISQPRINLFDRQIEVRNSQNIESLKSLFVYLLVFPGIFIFAPPMGCIWHLGSCVYQAIRWMKKGEEQTYFKEHFLSFIKDLAWTVCIAGPAAYISSEYLREIHSFGETIATGVLVLIVILIEILMLSIIMILVRSCCNTTSIQCLSKPYALKEQFGLVGENGWILSFNSEVDTESCTLGEERGTVQLNGHFYDIQKKQAEKALRQVKKIVQCTQLQLEEERLREFSKDPKRFLQFLQTSNDINVLRSKIKDKNRLENPIVELNKYLDNYRLITNAHFRTLESDTLLGLGFVVAPEVCRRYFTYQDQESPAVPSKIIPRI